MKHIFMIAIVLVFCFGGLSAGPVATTSYIEWTHPGDNENVQNDTSYASIIEWKWIADITLPWSEWNMITDTITPRMAGTIDTLVFDIEFPTTDIDYFIGVRAGDEIQPYGPNQGKRNWSDVCFKVKVVLWDQTPPGCSPGRLIRVEQ